MDREKVEVVLDTKSNLNRIEVARVLMMLNAEEDKYDHLSDRDLLYVILHDSGVELDEIERILDEVEETSS